MNRSNTGQGGMLIFHLPYIIIEFSVSVQGDNTLQAV